MAALAAPAAAATVAAAAYALATLAPLVGAPIMALVIGTAVAVVVPAGRLRAGLGVTSRRLLQVAIVALGATISLQQVVRVGASSLPVMLGTLSGALLAAALLGRALGVTERLRILIGVGTGICGASAIAAVTGVIDARTSETRYAIFTIFTLNLAAVLLFPPLGHALGMSPHAFGVWAGTAVNDTSSVVAAGFAYGHQAGTDAVIVKLARTTMIVPIVLALGALAARRRRTACGDTAPPPRALLRLRGLTPWFLVWFVAACGLNSLGAVGPDARAAFSHAGLALTTVALGAVGLSTDLRQMRRAGWRPLALGALVWITVSTVSLALQALTGVA